MEKLANKVKSEGNEASAVVKSEKNEEDDPVKREAKEFKDIVNTLTNKIKIRDEKLPLSKTLYEFLEKPKDSNEDAIFDKIAQLTLTPKPSELSEKYNETINNTKAELKKLAEKTPGGVATLIHGALSLLANWSPAVTSTVNLNELAAQGKQTKVSLQKIVDQNAFLFKLNYNTNIDKMAQSWDAVIKNAFSKIQLSEFHCGNWLNKDKDTLAPNLKSFTELEIKTIAFYKNSILKCKDPNQQARMIALTTDTAVTLLKKYHNLNGCIALLSAITQVRNTDGMKIALNEPKIKEKIDELRNLSLNRDELNRMQDSSIPSVGLIQNNLNRSAEGSLVTPESILNTGKLLEQINQNIKQIAQQPPTTPSTNIVQQALR